MYIIIKNIIDPEHEYVYRYGNKSHADYYSTSILYFYSHSYVTCQIFTSNQS
jgi:hypothetical protein